jgi:hypothetical protein
MQRRERLLKQLELAQQWITSSNPAQVEKQLLKQVPSHVMIRPAPETNPTEEDPFKRINTKELDPIAELSQQNLEKLDKNPITSKPISVNSESIKLSEM